MWTRSILAVVLLAGGSLLGVGTWFLVHRMDDRPLEARMPIRLRDSEVALKRQVAACLQEPAGLEGGQPNDLKYTCDVRFDSGFGVTFSSIQTVTRSQSDGSRLVMPVIGYLSRARLTAAECDSLVIRAGSILQRTWSDIKRMEDQEGIGVIGMREHPDGSIESLAFACMMDKGTSLTWMHLGPPARSVVIGEQSGDDFFKGIEIAMKVDPPATRKVRRRSKKAPQNGDEGDDETLTGEQVQSVMNQNFKLGGCLKEEAQRNPGLKKLDLEFQIRGSGVVNAVKVNGESGSMVASCVFAKMRLVNFPKLSGQKTHASFSLALK